MKLAVENQDAFMAEAQNRAHEDIRNAKGFVSDTAPQFAVGDIVRHETNAIGKLLMVDSGAGMANAFWLDDLEECDCRLENLTLIAKAVKP